MSKKRKDLGFFVTDNSCTLLGKFTVVGRKGFVSSSFVL